ncbi:hypothetical protein GCM10023219_08020 [Stakelama sediminis]|uniref:Pilus assembly protein CpaB n=1 Tax=Stakelama sediminis TaxID=463200 RepID=A0A840YV55_9SPHN|nr:Flp pilus assembly protein CpaB [Stakelama sediminis]MBB5717523.1 pilus assembly protein CpaB [Stakelama sediminis]
MDARKIILLVGALVVAGLTAFMARSLMMGSTAPEVSAAPPPTVVTGPKVLIAKKALPVGTILTTDSFTFQPWPKDLVENAYYIEGKTDQKSLLGTVVRYAIPAGQPITQGALIKPGDRGFLAAALAPGMRAVTVPVSAQSAVAGFVFPGDRVDLLLTQSVPGGGDGPPLKAAETILRNLRVLATDQSTENETDENGKPVIKPYSTVTVEATPKIAEEIAVAQTLGTLSLSLRSIADNKRQLEAAIASGEINVPDDGDPKKEKEMLAAVDAMPIDARKTYSTGADVSRFQRSTVPGKASSESGNMGMAPSGPSFPGGATPAVTGPVVRVARGNTVTVVPVGGKK